MPFWWVSGNTETFTEEPRLNSRLIFEDTENQPKLYSFEWNHMQDELVQALVLSDAIVLDVEGNHERWSFRVLFEEHKDISTFYSHCTDKDVGIEVKKMGRPSSLSERSLATMTATQARTLVDAYEAGYFDIPRKTSIVELSERYGVSDQAVSERIRRATAQLVKSSLAVEEEHLQQNIDG